MRFNIIVIPSGFFKSYPNMDKGLRTRTVAKIIFVHCYIKGPMKRVLNGPMGSGMPEQLLRCQFLVPKIRSGGLATLFSPYLALCCNRSHHRQGQPVMRPQSVTVMTHRSGKGFDQAMSRFYVGIRDRDGRRLIGIVQRPFDILAQCLLGTL